MTIRGGKSERRARLEFLAQQVAVVVAVLVAISLTLLLVFEIRRLLLWLAVAVFFAAVLTPAVAWVERRGLPRGLAIALVVVSIVLVLLGVIALFARPVIDQATQFSDQLPSTLDRLRALPLVRQFLDRLDIKTSGSSLPVPNDLTSLSSPVLAVFRSVGEALVALLTITVFTVFLLMYGPGFSFWFRARFPEREHRRALDRIAARSLHSVSGWVAGNVLTSAVAGIAATAMFLVLGLPYPALLGLWVGVADLIPLVGATLGALPAIVVAFLHGVPTGIITLVFFIVYQQIENHALQPMVYARTIQLNPFLVLLAVLVGVELLGFVGALLALPVAGVIQVAVEELKPEAITTSPEVEAAMAAEIDRDDPVETNEQAQEKAGTTT